MGGRRLMPRMVSMSPSNSTGLRVQGFGFRASGVAGGGVTSLESMSPSKRTGPGFQASSFGLRVWREGHAQQLHRNVQRFRGGPVFKAHRRCVSLNSRLESNKERRGTHKLAAHGVDVALEEHRPPLLDPPFHLQGV